MRQRLGSVTTGTTELFPRTSIAAINDVPRFAIVVRCITHKRVISFTVSLLVVNVLVVLIFNDMHVKLVNLVPGVAPTLIINKLVK